MARGGGTLDQTDILEEDALLETQYAVNGDVGTLIILAGTPGAGKSTLSRAQFPSARVISPDQLRGVLYNSAGEWDQGASKRAFARAHRDLEQQLKAGALVLFDATNTNMDAIGPLVAIAREIDAPVHLVVLNAELERAHASNETRNHTDPLRYVPPAVIDRMGESLEALLGLPDLSSRFDSLRVLDESDLAVHTRGYASPVALPVAAQMSEGARHLQAVLTSPDVSSQLRAMAQDGSLAQLMPKAMEMVGFEQHNRHHDQTVFEHALTVIDEVNLLSDYDVELAWAAFFHDICKPETFWQDEDGWGHFYARFDKKAKRLVTRDHEVAAAMVAHRYVAENGFSPEQQRAIVHYVRWHMQKITANNEYASARQFLQRTGQYADKLLILHAADDASKAAPADHAKAIAQLARQRQLIEQIRSGSAPDRPQAPVKLKLAVPGNELAQAAGLQGPAIGELVQHLQASVNAKQITNDRDILIAAARAYRA